MAQRGWCRRLTAADVQLIAPALDNVTTPFEVLRRRWVVERTFAWIVKNRRFVRDYEQLTAVSETLITITATATLIRRWP